MKNKIFYVELVKTSNSRLQLTYEVLQNDIKHRFTYRKTDSKLHSILMKLASKQLQNETSPSNASSTRPFDTRLYPSSNVELISPASGTKNPAGLLVHPRTRVTLEPSPEKEPAPPPQQKAESRHPSRGPGAAQNSLSRNLCWKGSAPLAIYGPEREEAPLLGGIPRSVGGVGRAAGGGESRGGRSAKRRPDH